MNIWKLTVISGKVRGRDLTVRQIIVIKWFIGFSGKNAHVCRAKGFTIGRAKPPG